MKEKKKSKKNERERKKDKKKKEKVIKTKNENKNENKNKQPETEIKNKTEEINIWGEREREIDKRDLILEFYFQTKIWRKIFLKLTNYSILIKLSLLIQFKNKWKQHLFQICQMLYISKGSK